MASGYNLVVALLADITMTDAVSVGNIRVTIRPGADRAPARRRRQLSDQLRGDSHTCRFVDNDGTSCYTVGGGDAAQLLRVRSGGWLSIENITLRDGFAPPSAQGLGGAIFVQDGRVDVKNCALTDHTAWSTGGAVANYYGTVNFYHCILKRNLAEFGGAYFSMGNNAKDAFMLVQGCTITDNVAQIDGGGMYTNARSLATLRNCALSGNTAGEWGAAMVNLASCLLANCT